MGSVDVTDDTLRVALAGLCEHLDFLPPDSWTEYLALANRWGQRMNLTAARDAATLCELLFVDAIAVLKAECVPDADTWVDIGAGVGAPTIPVALCRPKIRATLVEPRRKRVAFLRSAVGALGLADRVDVREERIDPNAPSVNDDTFAVALSRATFEPAQWLTIGLQLAHRVLVFGTRDAPPKKTPAQTVSYRVPSTNAPRTLFVFEREA